LATLCLQLSKKVNASKKQSVKVVLLEGGSLTEVLFYLGWYV